MFWISAKMKDVLLQEGKGNTLVDVMTINRMKGILTLMMNEELWGKEFEQLGCSELSDIERELRKIKERKDKGSSVQMTISSGETVKGYIEDKLKAYCDEYKRNDDTENRFEIVGKREFSQGWKHAMHKTEVGEFMNADGETEKCVYMHGRAEAGIEENGMSACYIGYKGERYGFVGVTGCEDYDILKGLREGKITNKELMGIVICVAKVVRGGAGTSCRFKLPMFKAEMTLKGRDFLSEKMMEPKSYSGVMQPIGGKDDIILASAKSSLEVNKDGATGKTFARVRCTTLSYRKEIGFLFEEPFLYFIVDNQLKEVVYAGVVNEIGGYMK